MCIATSDITRGVATCTKTSTVSPNTVSGVIFTTSPNFYTKTAKISATVL